MLRETHFGLGKESLEYTLPAWSVISSPDPKNGVAIIISHRVARAEALQYRAVQPGRILHVRFPVGQGRQARSVDVVSAYQWAWDADPAKGRLEARRKFLDEISNLVQSFPKRNVHCVAGDFNRALSPQGQNVGQGLYSTKQAQPDSPAFGDFVRHTGLCALNTWTRARSAYTFEMPGDICKRTHIDFVLASACTADLRAKRAQPTDEVCFSPWRGGGRHRAVVASLRLGLPLQPTEKVARLSFSRLSLRDALRTHSQESQQLRRLIEERISSDPPATTESLNRLLIGCCESLFPHIPQPKAVRAWQTQEVQASVRQLWAERHAVRAACDSFRRSRALGAIFQIWRSATRLHVVQSQLRKRSHDKRKRILIDTLQQAEDAVQKGDMYTLYRHIQSLAPKQSRGRVQLHSAQGAMLSAEQEFNLIKDYFNGVFNRDPLLGPKSFMPSRISRRVCAFQHVSPAGWTRPARTMDS